MEFENPYFEILWMLGIGLPHCLHLLGNTAEFPLSLGELLSVASSYPELFGDDSGGRVMVGNLLDRTRLSLEPSTLPRVDQSLRCSRCKPEFFQIFKSPFNLGFIEIQLHS